MRGDATTLHHGEPWKLNLDILLLIATQTNPSDLLSFACTCRRFKEYLMFSDLILKTARRKFRGLPDCPADLTEWEYTDLAFRPRCHGCGKYASRPFWEMRRRYCPDCSAQRLCHISSCPQIIQDKYVLGAAQLTIRRAKPFWVDKEQMELFMEAYEHSSDKNQFLIDRQERLLVICNHAHKCEVWQRNVELPLRRKREESIFQRLEQLGYKPDIEYVEPYAIRDSRISLFNTSKPLTDKEWNQIGPALVETMNKFRLQRLEKTVFQSRRHSLAREYNTYVKSQNAPSFELLPHVADVACFTPFRDIIRAPEGTYEEGELFESAFAQLPGLVDEWRKKLDAELAELVQIPPQLSFDDASDDQMAASNNATSPESLKAPADKFRLACALFRETGKGLFTHPEIFFVSMCDHKYPKEGEDDSGRSGSIRDRFQIRWVEEAARVVHACGLDPNVATAEDMNRQDARLECCGRFYDWEEATWHAHDQHQWGDRPSWKRVDDAADVTQIRTAERIQEKSATPHTSRCLLCIPRVGSAKNHREVQSHMSSHDSKIKNIKHGVHYASVAKADHRWVEKVKKPREEGFRFEARRKQLTSGYWY